MRFLKPKSKDTLKFLAIAVAIMIVVNYFVFDKHGYHEEIRKEYYVEQAKLEAEAEARAFDPVAEDFYTKNPPQMVYPDDGQVYFEAKPPEPVKEDIQPAEEVKPPVKSEPLSPRHGQGGKIAIVIDDVGMNRKWSKAAIELNYPMTLAFLPYAPKVGDLAEKAKANGHEAIIHAPMEAMSADVPLGDLAFTTNMSRKDFEITFDQMTQKVGMVKGLNNHMGSKLTQDEDAMERLMKLLKIRQLYFLDSRTIHTSIAAEMAETHGVPYAVRDVFLDHEESKAYVSDALAKVERIATEHGQAIAIGHPKENTIEALEKWLPTLEKRGFEVVVISELIYPSDAGSAYAIY